MARQRRQNPEPARRRATNSDVAPAQQQVPPVNEASSEPVSHPDERPNQALRVLIVDDEQRCRRQLAECFAGSESQVVEAATLADARELLAKSAYDLALIDHDLPDGSGITLAEEVKHTRPLTQTIVVSGRPTLQRAIDAMRVGASDFIPKPLNTPELTERIRIAVLRHRTEAQRAQRLHRLRRVCKKLNQARHEVTQQVDTICSDLVTAYQELAQQMHQVTQASEYAGLVKHELDLESLLRKTLEYVLSKSGPTNVAIFLPASADEYSLGGYVNYDCTSESADVLLQHLADVVAPRVAARQEPVHITDNATLKHWIGDDAAYLADSHVLAFACRHKNEPLAVMVLFRDGAQPFASNVFESCGVLSPMLGEYLNRIIRIHHRSLGTLADDAPGQAA